MSKFENDNIEKKKLAHLYSESADDDPYFVNHLRHPLAITILSLLLREERQALKQIIIDDEENVLQALDAKIHLNQIITTDKNDLSSAFLAKVTDIPIIEIAKRTSKKIFGNEKISRIFALAATPASLVLDALTTLKKDIVVLDKLSISGNIGAVIRTAVALDAGGIVLLDADPVDIFDRRVIRASRGCVFKIPIVCTNTKNFVSFCRDNSIKMLATTPYTDLSIDEAMQYQDRLALIFGNEKEGCSKELLNAAQLKVKIPISEGIESLNVSTAASIILYLRNLHYRHYKIEKA